MNSHTIFNDKRTGHLIAAHQRIVRAARRQTLYYVPKKTSLPSVKEILRFEGKNGPDGLAGKKSKGDYPHDFIDPADNDDLLFGDIRDFLFNLNRAYKKNDNIKIAFEMAWLSHLVIDGLTPPHHQPFKKQLKELDGVDTAEINSRLKRIFVPGDNPVDFLVKSWKRLGPKGIGTNHVLFETGIDFLLMPRSPKSLLAKIANSDVNRVKSGKFFEVYDESVQKIARMRMFEQYEKSGWTTELADDVRNILVPEAVKCVTLAWLAGIYKGR